MSKILLVDDEPKVLRALTAALEEKHEVYVSETGVEAKSAINDSGPFDAIISDELMPGVKGHELLNWCQRKTPQSKLMMLTGLPVTEELKQKIDNVGNISIFTKPWDVGAINKAIPQTSISKKVDLQSDTNLKDNKSRMAVLEGSERYRSLYSQFEGLYYDEVVFFRSDKRLLSKKAVARKIGQVIINVEAGDQYAHDLIETVCDHYPKAGILVTAPPHAVLELSHDDELPDRVTLLAKPFSFKRLVTCLKPEKRRN